jgi:replicative DNA helicase
VSASASLEAVRPAPIAVPGGRIPPQNLDAERSVLGGVLLDNAALNEILELLKPEDFYRDAHRKVFEAMCALSSRGEPIDRVTLKDELTSLGAYDAVGGEDFIDLLDKLVPSAANLTYYATIVHEKALARRVIEAAHAIATQGYEQAGEVGEFLDDAERRIFAITEEKAQSAFMHVREIVKSTFKTIELLYERQEEITGISTGFADLDRLTSGFQPGDLVILAARPSMGKAQPLDAPVLTPTGYLPMGEVQPGSFVMGVDGKPIRVLAVFPQGVKPVFRVRFTDGATVECCDEHLWLTTTLAESRRPGSGGSVKPLSEIRQSLYVAAEAGRLDHRVPLVAPIEFAPRDRPLLLPPYLLGLLLGDGSFRDRGAPGSASEEDLRERLPSDAFATSTVTVDGIATAIPRKSTTRHSGTRLALEHYGLYGLGSLEKFIPTDYLFASAGERLDLLRALLDTDGEVTVPGGRLVAYSPGSPRLAEGVRWLVRSLGGLVETGASGMLISFPNGIVPVSSRKHLARWNPHADGFPERFIESVEPAGEKPCQCILVESDDHLYVTSDFVVTHNTACCLNVATHVGCRARYNGKRIGVGIFSLEMPKEQLVMRMLSSEARVDSQRIRTGRLIESDWPKLAHAAGGLADANIHIDDSPGMSALELRAKSRRLAGRFADSEAPLGLIVVDYLQLMKGNERIDSREQQISEISRSLKALAKELNIPVLALSQLNRSLEKRPDKRPQLSDLRECVTGDTLVLLADGRRAPIRELVGQEPDVLAVSTEHRVVKARAEKVWSVGQREVYELKLASGRVIRCTSRHRLLTGGGWQRVGELSPGARVALARSVPEPAHPDRWPEARLVLLGHLIGDGSYVVHQPLRYTTASEENSAAVAKAAREEFGTPVKRTPGRGNWHQLCLGGNGNRWHLAGIRAWLRDLGVYGQRSHQKRIPTTVFQLSNEQIAVLLRHLWATDGSITVRGNRGNVYFSTCSHGLARDVASLLLRLGVVARIATTLKAGDRPLYGVHVSGAPDQLRFLALVGGFGPRTEPARRLGAILARITPNTNVDTLPVEVFDTVRERMGLLGITQRRMAAMRGTSYGGTSHFAFAPSRAVVAGYADLLDDARLRVAATSHLFWDRLVSITPAGMEEVFDLTVPGPASWLADGIVSHNSGALEQDADTIIFLFREEVYEKDKEDVKGIAEIIVGKQRNGPIGVANAAFIHEFTRFENLARDYVPHGSD